MIDILTSVLVIVFIIALVLFWLTFFDWYVSVRDISDNHSITYSLVGFVVRFFCVSLDYFRCFVYRRLSGD